MSEQSENKVKTISLIITKKRTKYLRSKTIYALKNLKHLKKLKKTKVNGKMYYVYGPEDLIMLKCQHSSNL